MGDAILYAPYEQKIEKVLSHVGERRSYSRSSYLSLRDWTTAASFRIGCVFEEFARFFWESPRQQISEELMAKYEEQLLQKIRPFKEKALAAYQANVKQAEENGINNQWIDQSRQRIQILVGELGLAAPSNDVTPANGAVQEKPNGTGNNNVAQQGNGQFK